MSDSDGAVRLTCLVIAIVAAAGSTPRDRTETMAMTPIATPQFAGLAAVGRG